MLDNRMELSKYRLGSAKEQYINAIKFVDCIEQYLGKQTILENNDV